MFRRAYQRLLVILFSIMYLVGNGAWWWHLNGVVDWWWLAAYTIFFVVVWIRMVKRLWPRKPVPNAKH